MFRALLSLLCLLPPLFLIGRTYTDSLHVIAVRLSERIAQQQHHRVAVIGVVTNAADQPLTDEIVGELTYQLARQAKGFGLVERGQLEVVLQEHRLTAAGLTNDAGALQLGGLACANAIVTARIMPVDKRHVLLELKVLNTEDGLLQGMERSVIDLPEGYDTKPDRERPDLGISTPDRRNDAFEWNAGLVYGGFFGKTYPAARMDLWLRGGRPDALGSRIPGAIAIGLRLQYMPGIGGPLPTVVDFGHLSTTSDDPFAMPDFFGTSSTNGDVFLVPANDLSYGATALSDAMALGNSTATWQQIRPVFFSAGRWSAMIPVRWYMNASARDNQPKVFTEFGFGADVLTMKAQYDVTSITGVDGMNGASYTARSYRSEGSFTPKADERTVFWNGMLGLGVEIGRFGLAANWQRSFHATPLDLGRDVFRVHGDPIAIALLHGDALDDLKILDEIAAQGAIRFGSTDHSTGTKSFAVMDRFLDRSHFLVALSYRLH